MHQVMAATLDAIVADIQHIQRDARKNGFKQRPRWPMIILRSPKGWTGPDVVDGKPVEGTFRAHQVPVAQLATKPRHLKILEQWMKSYRLRELFDRNGRLLAELAELAPKGERRMGANPHANGGLLLRDLNMPDFRVFSPDETVSNRWSAVLEVTNRSSTAEILPTDDHVAADGRVMEMLSEHQCEGWLEGYLLTRRIPWRRPIASLNYLLSSHVWRQDHNGFTHRDPGFIDLVANKNADIIRVYLPPDANTLLAVTDHCLRSRHYVNVIVAGKQPSPQWLDMESAVKHCTAGLGIWKWASNDEGGEPDVVMTCAGDVPTMETLAAVMMLRQHFPKLAIRVINVVDLMVLQPQSEHPHGLSDKDFDVLFTRDKPIVFAFHGYPSLIHQLTYRRTNHHNLHVRGYKEEGTTTTPFDMAVRNDIDRFHLVKDVVDRVSSLGPCAAYLTQFIRDKLIDHQRYIRQHGEDMPEIRNWKWGARDIHRAFRHHRMGK